MKACGFSDEVAGSYIAKLHEDGYETVADLQDMELDEFIECGLKKGHAKRLVKELKALGSTSSAGGDAGTAGAAASPAPAAGGGGAAATSPSPAPASGSGAAAVRALKQPEGDVVNFENGTTQEKLDGGVTVQTDADGTKIFVYPVS